MHWIYLIKCKNEKYYVGETKSLYSRLNQHVKKRGSKHTIHNEPLSLCGLYKVHSNYRFLMYNRESKKENTDIKKITDILDNFNNVEYNNKDWARTIEDYITEILMQYDDIEVFGGKYVNDNKDTIDKQFDCKELNYIPLCDCGFPAEIQMKKYSNKYYKLYFSCCIKNVWSDMRHNFKLMNIEEPCHYYSEYMEHLENRLLN